MVSAAAGAAASADTLTAPAARDARPAGLTDLERTDRKHLLRLVDKTRPLHPIDYAPRDLVQWGRTEYQLRAEVADQLAAMTAAAAERGHDLRVISGYRSYRTQRSTYDYWVAHYGRRSADATSARPGHSEHQTGLAVDLDGPGGCYLEPCFGSSRAGRWVAARAYRYGFVLSYPEGMKARTGYAYEPWHVRYVGPRTAYAMHELGVPLLADYLAAHTRTLGLGAELGERPAQP